MRYLIAFLLTLGVLGAASTASGRNIKKKNNILEGFITDRPVKENNSITKRVINFVDSVSVPDDTVYCLRTSSHLLWRYPRYIVSKDIAAKMPLSIRLSNKNKQGNFCRMELLGRDLKPIKGRFSLPISLLVDPRQQSDILKEWTEETSRVDFISDHEGKNVFQMRLYDINNNLLGYVSYDYSKDFSRYNERYQNKYGLPTSLTKSEGPYGIQLTTITDKNGNDSILSLSLNRSIVKNKYDSEYIQQLYSTDSLGRKWSVLKFLDEKGTPQTQHGGYSGIMTLFDRNDNDSITYYIDENTNLNNGGYHIESGSSMFSIYDEKACIIKNEYNGYAQLTKRSFYDKEGQPIELDVINTHEVIYTYDANNNADSIYGRNLNHKFSPLPTDMYVSLQTFKYDQNGNITEYHQYDDNLKPTFSLREPSSYYKTYDNKSNRLLKHIRYKFDSNNDQEIKDYEYIVQDTCIQEIIDGVVRYKALTDNKGRYLSKERFDHNGLPASDEYYAKQTFGYLDDSPNISWSKEFYSNNLIKRISVYDSIQLWGKEIEYDTIGNTIKSYRYSDNSNDESHFITCNRFGNISRINGSYYWLGRKTLSGEYYHYSFYDEFFEPDYLITNDGNIYSTKGGNRRHYGEVLFLDENGITINPYENNKLRDMLSKAISIEVIDSSAYRLGLKDNDLILRYGDYNVNLSHPLKEKDFKIQWTIRSVINANKQKDMVVFRIENGSKGEYGLKTISNLSGTPSEIGFVPHIKYLTAKQRDRIISCLNKESNLSVLSDVDTVQKTKYVYVDFPFINDLAHNGLYADSIKDAGILLGAIDLDRNIKWDAKDRGEAYKINKMLSNPWRTNRKVFPRQRFFFTTNGQSTVTLESDSRFKDLNLLKTYISDKDYYELEKLYEEVADEIDSIRNIKKNLDKGAKNYDVTGYWTVTSNDSNLYQPEGFLYLKKDGKCSGKLTGYTLIPQTTIQEDKGSPVFKIERNLDGRWIGGNHMIVFYPDDEQDIDISCVDIVEYDGDKAAAIAYFNEDIKEYFSYYDKKMQSINDITNEAFIQKLDKKTLVLNDGCGNEIQFVKSKGKPLSKNNKYTITR